MTRVGWGTVSWQINPLRGCDIQGEKRPVPLSSQAVVWLKFQTHGKEQSLGAQTTRFRQMFVCPAALEALTVGVEIHKEAVTHHGDR